MKKIYIYKTPEEYESDTPTSVITGIVKEYGQHMVTVKCENGYTHLLSLQNVFAIVF